MQRQETAEASQLVRSLGTFNAQFVESGVIGKPPKRLG